MWGACCFCWLGWGGGTGEPVEDPCAPRLADLGGVRTTVACPAHMYVPNSHNKSWAGRPFATEVFVAWCLADLVVYQISCISPVCSVYATVGPPPVFGKVHTVCRRSSVWNNAA